MLCHEEMLGLVPNQGCTSTKNNAVLGRHITLRPKSNAIVLAWGKWASQQGALALMETSSPSFEACLAWVHPAQTVLNIPCSVPLSGTFSKWLHFASVIVLPVTLLQYYYFGKLMEIYLSLPVQVTTDLEIPFFLYIQIDKLRNSL